MNALKAHIDSSFSNKDQICWTEAKYLLLENENPLTLGLTVVGIGCDVLPGGVPGITANTICKELIRLEKEEKISMNNYGQIYSKLMEFFIKNDKSKKFTELDLQTICQAFLYQPALEFGKKDDVSAYRYVFHKPATLSPYLKRDFLPPDVETDNEEERELLKCKGIQGINKSHTFLKAEGNFICFSCQTCFCQTCGYSPGKDRDGNKSKTKSLILYENVDEDLCVDCYKEKIFLPFLATIDDALSISEMKLFLKNSNQTIPNDIKAHEIQEMYEMCKVILSRNTEVDETVPFPIFLSNSLEITDSNNVSKFKFGCILHLFNLDQGGIFIHGIDDEDVITVVNLLASIVKYGDKKDKYTEFDSPVYDVLPQIYIEFANKSRDSAGFRLLKRCLRHAFDPKSHPLMEHKAMIFRNKKDGEIGLSLTNKIAASMKDAEYEVRVAFTKNDLLATKCECKAGGDEMQRVVCVHTLPVIYQLTMLLDDGLSEHLLVENCQ